MASSRTNIGYGALFLFGLMYVFRPQVPVIPVARPVIEPQLSSVIPGLYQAAKHQFLDIVDLRRADVAELLDDIDDRVHVEPLMDKVLVVPKLFKLNEKTGSSG